MPESVLMHPITDMEKMFALFGKMFENQRDISQKLTDNKFPIDTYDDDPNGATGILTPNPIYNGPWVITGILATWVATAPTTSAILQLGDRTFQLPPTAGFFSATDLYIQMQHDDTLKLSITPVAACHIELMGWANKRRTDTAE